MCVCGGGGGGGRWYVCVCVFVAVWFIVLQVTTGNEASIVQQRCRVHNLPHYQLEDILISLYLLNSIVILWGVNDQEFTWYHVWE